MSRAIETIGWTGPKGKCDMCGERTATHWFGDTSVALCNDERCIERNNANWQRMLDGVNEADDA